MIPRGVILLVAAAMLIPLTVSAQEVYVPPKTAEAQSVKDLFDITTAIAVVVFIITEAALFYVIWRFRKNRTVPTGEEHRGHTAAEITWTVIPALILIFLGVLAVNTLQEIEIVPAETATDAVDVYAEAGRFAFTFYYPDENGEIDRTLFDDELNVVTGTQVRLTITSVDNQHAIWIPEFAVKVDAYPNVENVVFFTAPEVGEYFVQCAEYCGDGHHAMHSMVNVVAEETFENGARVGVIREAGAEVPPGPEFEVALLEEPGETPGIWTVDPARLEVTLANETEGIHILAPNPEQNGSPHNLTVAGRVFTPGGAYPAGAAEWLNFTLEMVGGPGEYQYWCAVPGHRDLGMEGTIVIRVEGQ